MREALLSARWTRRRSLGIGRSFRGWWRGALPACLAVLVLMVAGGCSTEGRLAVQSDVDGQSGAEDAALSDVASSEAEPGEVRMEPDADGLQLPDTASGADVPDLAGQDGSDAQGDADGVHVGELQEDVGTEAFCVPDCPGSCGPDGCGGSCGECSPGADCVDGTCSGPIPCQSSKDCEIGVCDKALGICVECLEDVDCNEGFRCTDGLCVEAPPCLSDKDCKALEMVCDKEAGYCVGCLVDFDCADGQFCKGDTCVADVCAAGTDICKGGSAWTCSANGSEYLLQEVCVEAYCDGGACQPWVCEPGTAFCQGSIAMLCNGQGSAVESEADCEAFGMTCSQGECVPLVCLPGAVWCVSGNAKAVCAPDGSGYETTSCGLEEFCWEAVCQPWVCEPLVSYCAGNVALVCDLLGKGPEGDGEDCLQAGKTCVDGACICIPQCEGKECGDDGCGGSCGTCPATAPCMSGFSCVAGKCTGFPIPGCCVADKECDDQDKCTTDKCTANKCGHVDICCDSDLECNDFDDVCTIDKCVDGACVYAPTGVAGCCSLALFRDDFSTDKGWTYGPEWGRGVATQSSGQVMGSPDPDVDHTSTSDNYVAGVAIGGNASAPVHDFYWATSPVINAQSAKNLQIGYWRWLNSDYVPFMQNRVEVYDGAKWVTIWQTEGFGTQPQDAAWTFVQQDISAYANSKLQVRFGFKIGSAGVFTVSGWNLDDVTVTSMPGAGAAGLCCSVTSDCQGLYSEPVKCVGGECTK